MMGLLGLYFAGLRPSKMPACGGARLAVALAVTVATDTLVADMVIFFGQCSGDLDGGYFI